MHKTVNAIDLDDAGRAVIIEASDRCHDWDSDYVGNQTMTLDEARKYIHLMESGKSDDDQDWDGWEFRIVGKIDGCYCGIVD